MSLIGIGCPCVCVCQVCVLTQEGVYRDASVLEVVQGNKPAVRVQVDQQGTVRAAIICVCVCVGGWVVCACECACVCVLACSMRVYDARLCRGGH